MSATWPRRKPPGRILLAAVVLLPLVAGCLPPRGTAGERLYRRHCASCHGVDGGGGVRYQANEGANLLDDTWKYGSDRSELEYSLLNEEISEHTDWSLTHQQRQLLVDQILALRGESR